MATRTLLNKSNSGAHHVSNPVYFAGVFCLTASADQHRDGPPNPCHIFYPNIPGELLLENGKLVVQRFIIAPGQWEGIHRHPPDQLYIHVKGGEWTVKYGGEATTSNSPDGAVGWSDAATEMSAMHESGNTGADPIDLIWATLKPGAWLIRIEIALLTICVRFLALPS